MKDTAYFPGTGPDDKLCKDCGEIFVVSKRNGKCRKAAEFRRCSVMALDTISLSTLACKYFEAQQ